MDRRLRAQLRRVVDPHRARRILPLRPHRRVGRADPPRRPRLESDTDAGRAVGRAAARRDRVRPLVGLPSATRAGRRGIQRGQRRGDLRTRAGLAARRQRRAPRSVPRPPSRRAITRGAPPTRASTRRAPWSRSPATTRCRSRSTARRLRLRQGHTRRQPGPGRHRLPRRPTSSEGDPRRPTPRRSFDEEPGLGTAQRGEGGHAPTPPGGWYRPRQTRPFVPPRWGPAADIDDDRANVQLDPGSADGRALTDRGHTLESAESGVAHTGLVSTVERLSRRRRRPARRGHLGGGLPRRDPPVRGRVHRRRHLLRHLRLPDHRTCCGESDDPRTGRAGPLLGAPGARRLVPASALVVSSPWSAALSSCPAFDLRDFADRARRRPCTSRTSCSLTGDQLLRRRCRAEPIPAHLVPRCRRAVLPGVAGAVALAVGR